MKFCPKCGGAMVPRVEAGKRYLVCVRCGYKEEAGSKDVAHYKGVEKAKEKVLTTKTVSRLQTKKMSKEELESIKEEYYEFVLDQMGEYGE
ncbi:MAG: transcription elongation factor [Desulfurococcales archaeon]|nr:transcription elongation factor [Desulfurococcales archaeon]